MGASCRRRQIRTHREDLPRLPGGDSHPPRSRRGADPVRLDPHLLAACHRHEGGGAGVVGDGAGVGGVVVVVRRAVPPVVAGVPCAGVDDSPVAGGNAPEGVVEVDRTAEVGHWDPRNMAEVDARTWDAVRTGAAGTSRTGACTVRGTPVAGTPGTVDRTVDNADLLEEEVGTDSTDAADAVARRAAVEALLEIRESPQRSARTAEVAPSDHRRHLLRRRREEDPGHHPLRRRRHRPAAPHHHPPPPCPPPPHRS